MAEPTDYFAPPDYTQYQTAKVYKSVIAPARHNRGSTSYMIIEQPDTKLYEIHESLLSGHTTVWPELSTGPHQAENLIFAWVQGVIRQPNSAFKPNNVLPPHVHGPHGPYGK